MNPANAVTSLRLIIVPLLAYTATIQSRTIFLALFVIGGLSDAIDGVIARKLKCQTPWGSAFDTVADVLFYPAGLLSALFIPELAEQWQIIVGVIALLGIAMTTCALRGKMSIEHKWTAKIGSLCMFLFIIYTITIGYSTIFFSIVAILAIIAAVDKFIWCVRC